MAHPGGLAKPLEYQFAQDVIQALIRIQRWVLYYKRRNRDRFPFCSTLFNCGATVITDKPRGEIQRLYTIPTDTATECCAVCYDFESDFDVFWNWLKFNRKTWTDPVNEGMAVLPAPFKYAEDTTDKGKRFNYGKWSIREGQQIWIGHRIESTETVIIEWLGVRRNWQDDTIMPYDDEGDEAGRDMGNELRTTVASYCRSEDLRKNRKDIPGWQAEVAVFNDLVAEMKHDDRTDNTPKLVYSHMLGEMNYDQSVTSCCPTPECKPEDA